MPSDTAEVLTRFYEAFSRRDGEAMAACYADDVQFSDPVFPGLEGERARDMWRMLCSRAEDLKVTHQVRAVTPDSGEVHWEAWYTFSATGRKVHNVIDARLEVRDGRIVRHTDRFGFYRWARQALGLPGLVLGWTPMLQRSVRARARQGLDAFVARR